MFVSKDAVSLRVTLPISRQDSGDRHCRRRRRDGHVVEALSARSQRARMKASAAPFATRSPNLGRDAQLRVVTNRHPVDDRRRPLRLIVTAGNDTRKPDGTRPPRIRLC